MEIDPLCRPFFARESNPSVRGAIEAEKGGADIIVATGCDEGGCMPSLTTGTTAATALLSEYVSIPVLAAGGIVDGFARWRTTPHKYGKEGVEANKRGDMNPPQGSFFYGMYKGDLDAGVNTVNNLTGLIKSIDACEDIVNELAAPFAE